MDPKLHMLKQRDAAEATAGSIANCASRLAKIDAKQDQILAAIEQIRSSVAAISTKPKAG